MANAVTGNARIGLRILKVIGRPVRAVGGRVLTGTMAHPRQRLRTEPARGTWNEVLVTRVPDDYGGLVSSQ